MAKHIPFVNSSTDDWKLVQDCYSDSEVIRVPLRLAHTIPQELRKKCRLWVDAEIDGYHYLLKLPSKPHWKDPFTFPRDIPKDPDDLSKGYKEPYSWWQDYTERIGAFAEYEHLAYEASLTGPDKQKLSAFVTAVLGSCAEVRPAWISVPQLPIVDGKERNAMNKALAVAASKWKAKARFTGKLILPVILTGAGQYISKTTRTDKIRTITACHKTCGFNGIWVVDSALSDQKGTKKYRDRFPALVSFHEELAALLPSALFSVAGPYWGMNLVLWARGAVDFPAVGIGRGYQYFVSGGPVPSGAKTRLPVPPIRRWVQTTDPSGKDRDALKKWLRKALAKLDKRDDAYRQLYNLHRRYAELGVKLTARGETARFYKQWLDEIESVPPVGRAMALWQTLSSAYALGKQLGPLPETGRSKDPALVARQFMLNCL